MFRTVILSGLVLAALAVSATAQKDDDKKKDKDKEVKKDKDKEVKKDKDKGKKTAAVYKSPEECFEAGTKAFEKGDHKTWIGCLAPIAQNEFAAEFGVEFISSRAQVMELKDKDQKEALLKAFKPIFDAMDKHGLTEKATKDVKKSKDVKEHEKAKKAVLKLVKDPEAFLVDLLTAFDSLGGLKDKNKAKEKLTNVKYDDDKTKATAVIVRTYKDKDEKEVERKEKVSFVKIDGGWRMVPQLKAEEESSGDDKKKDDKKKDDKKKDDKKKKEDD